MKNILAVTDFSKNGNNSVEYAAALAGEFRSKLIILHVYLTFTKKLNDTDSTENELKLEISTRLNDMKQSLETKHDISIETHIMPGEAPSTTISEFAKRNGIDLVVAGRTGTNLLERLVMGSTSSRLVHDCNCPVLCIPGETKFEIIKRIAFATDLKEDNINAALSLVTFAQHFNSEISFLYVDDKDLIHNDQNVAEMTSRIRSRINYPKLSGYVTKHMDIRKGIQNFLKHQEAQLLAMYTHSAEPSSNRFSVSLTSEMSEHTKIPLLALKKGIVSVA